MVEEGGQRSQDSAPDQDPVTDRAPGRAGQAQRADRCRGGSTRGHGAPLAGPVRRPGLARLGRPQASGAARRLTALQAAQVKALACQLPAERGTPLPRWSCPELACEAAAPPGRTGPLGVHRAPLAGPGRDQAPGDTTPGSSSPTSAFAPRQPVSWTGNARSWGAVPLGADEYIVGADEKTSIQARCRCHPTLAPFLHTSAGRQPGPAHSAAGPQGGLPSGP